MLASVAVIVVSVLATLLVVACNPVSQVTPSPTPEPLELQAGERLRIPFDPIAAPPDTNPQITIYLTFLDKVTGKPVTVRSIVLDGQVVAQNVTDFGLVVPGSLTDRDAVVAVEANGYKRWEVGLRWNIKHNRSFRTAVPLEPLTY